MGDIISRRTTQVSHSIPIEIYTVSAHMIHKHRHKIHKRYEDKNVLSFIV